MKHMSTNKLTPSNISRMFNWVQTLLLGDLGKAAQVLCSVLSCVNLQGIGFLKKCSVPAPLVTD